MPIVKTTLLSLLLFLFLVPAAGQTPAELRQLLDSMAFVTRNRPVQKLKTRDFNRGVIFQPVQLLQGRVPGLTIARPGGNPAGDFTVRIRGLSSVFSNTAPLIVIDGVPGGSLNLLDADDIASITVLKDAASTAHFGIRGAAGVLLVETNKGEPGPLRLAYGVQMGFDRTARRYEVLSANRFANLGGPDVSPQAAVDTDWQEAILRAGRTQAHQLSLSGGLGKGHFRTALNYRNAEGILNGTGLQQYSLHTGLQQQFWKNRLNVQATVAANRRDTDFGFTEAFRYAVAANPTAPVRSSDTAYAAYGGYFEQNLFDVFNPVAMLEQNSNLGRTDRFLGSLQTELKLAETFSIQVQIARDQQTATIGEYYSPQSRWRGLDSGGRVYRNTGEQRGDYLSAGGRYLKLIGTGTALQVNAGYNWQQFTYSTTQGQTNGVAGLTRNSDIGDFIALPEFDNAARYSGSNTLAGVYASAHLNFNNRYLLNASLRHEGSSRLGANRRWASFPALSAGANLVEILNLSRFDVLKIRAGYGIAGQQPNRDGLSRQIYQPGSLFYYNGSFVPAYYPATNENPDLSSEKRAEINLGMDMALAGGKLSGSLDYYRYKATDLIMPVEAPVPPNLANLSYRNIVELSGSGLEASVRWNHIVQAGDFDWSADLVYANYQVELERFVRDDTSSFGSLGAPGFCCGGYSVRYSGMPLGQFWGPVRTGVNPDGTVNYKDINRDQLVNPGEFNQDQTAIGNGMPDFELGVHNTLRWRRWDLDIFLRGVFGHQLVHEHRVFSEYLDPSRTNWNKVVTDYFDTAVQDFSRFSDWQVEKASFLRLDNLTMGYVLIDRPTGLLRKIRLYAGGQNLFTLTNYSGPDPELRLADPGPTDNGSRNIAAPDPLLPGIDRRNTWFPVRSWWFGLRAQF